jgi:hypothetical protein
MTVVVAVVGMAGIVAEDGAQGQASAYTIPISTVAAAMSAMEAAVTAAAAMKAASAAMTTAAAMEAAAPATAMTTAAAAVTAAAVALGVGCAGGACGQDERRKRRCDGFAIHDAAFSAKAFQMSGLNVRARKTLL